MGADIRTPHNPHHQDRVLSPNQSQYRINFASPYRQHNHPNGSHSSDLNYLSKDFRFTQESLAILGRQQIVENNFSQEFDPLFTTFRPQNKNIYGKFRILCSNITNEKIQEYKITFKNQTDLKTYLVSYFWRKNHSEPKNWPLVKTTNLRLYEQSKRMLKGGISGFISNNCSKRHDIYCRLYVEDIPLRLCHIKGIPFPENLYVLRQLFKGFQIIYENIGYIKPFQDLICITRKGVIKVWINSDLSKNFPNIQNIDENITSSKSESKLINEILDIVIKNTDSTGQPISFYAFLREHHVNLEFISFEKAFEMISRYEHQYEIEIPDTFASIVEVLNQQEEEYDTYRTDMEHGNEERGESSQPIRSNNRSGSGLFLDVPNTSSRMKFNQNHHKQKLSSKNQSSRQQKQKHKNKTHKTQSLKIGQKQRNSLESSLAGAKSNMMLSQSLPISRGMNQHPSSNEINGSGTSNKDVSKSRQNESNSQIQNLYEGNFIQIQRENEQEQKDKDDSVLAMKEIKQYEQEDQRQVSKSSIPFSKGELINGSQKQVHQHSGHQHSGRQIIQTHASNINPLHKHQIQTSSHLHNIRSTQPSPYQVPLYRQFHQSHHASNDQSIKIQSNNEIPLKNSGYPSQYLKNKKTYSNLWERKEEDYVLLNEEEIQLDSEGNMILRVEATEEEMEQMIEIDKFLQAQVIREEQQKLRLSQMYRSRNKLLNKSQQLSMHNHRQISKQAEQRLNQTTIPLPTALNNQSSSYISSRHQELSIPHMLTSRQKQLSNESALINNMHSSHHIPYLDEPSHDELVVNSHIVQRPARSIRPQHLSRNSEIVRRNLHREEHIPEEVQKHEKLVSPHSLSSLNSKGNQPLSFHQFNTHIEIQPPSSNQRTNRNSSNMLILDSQKTSQNNLPHIMISKSSNQVFVPISQHQILANNVYRLSPPPALLSSTSIGHSIVGPPSKNVYFNVNNNAIVSLPFQTEAHRIPKVTFITKTPQNMSYENIESSKNVSINQLAFSQQQVNAQQSHNLSQYPLTISHPSQTQSNHNVNRLSCRAHTMVSAYMHSQGGNNSSRKYYDHQQSSSYSKPSIVEYSYLRNPQYFDNSNHGLNEATLNENSQIPERSLENSLQKLPVLQANLIQQQNFTQNHVSGYPRSEIYHQYSYHSGYYEPHMNDIVPILEQSQAEMFNNSRSRSLVNNDEYIGRQNISNSLNKNPHKEHNQSAEQFLMASSKHEHKLSQHHKKQSSGVKMVESQKEEAPQNQQFVSSQQFLQSQQLLQNQEQDEIQRRQSYLMSEQYSYFIQDPIKSESSNHHNLHPQFKINIRPSFEPMSGCSQRQNQPFSNKSYIVLSKKQNSTSFLSGQERQVQNHLMVDQRASDQGSYQNEQSKNHYRIAESIQENRSNSTYQMDIDALVKDGQFAINIEEGSTAKIKGHIHDRRQGNGNLGNIYNQGKSHDGNNLYQEGVRSPRQQLNRSPRGVRVIQKPVTGRTMFLNKQNELLSDFIDPESQMQSVVDYTYKSYDKWKDRSKLMDLGPSRFREFDEKVDEEGEGANNKFNKIGFNYPERHGNHKQLVKSSIEGTKLLNHEFRWRTHFNTDQKQPQFNEAHQYNDQSSNQFNFESFSLDHRMELTQKGQLIQIRRISTRIFSTI